MTQCTTVLIKKYLTTYRPRSDAGYLVMYYFITHQLKTRFHLTLNSFVFYSELLGGGHIIFLLRERNNCAQNTYKSHHNEFS